MHMQPASLPPEFMLFTGNANPVLAAEIAKHLGTQLGAVDVVRGKVAPADAGPGGALASVATPPPLPSRQWKVSLKDLGVARPIALRGVESEASVGVSVRRDEAVESARLRLTFTLSPALIPVLSHLKVMLNDETLQTLVLDKERLGTPQTVELNIDPRYFTDYNRFRFQFIGHYTMECETPNHSSLWATISNESQLELSLRQIPLRDDLALLPAPFFDPRDNRPVSLPFVYGDKPSTGTLKASGSIASWIGMLADYTAMGGVMYLQGESASPLYAVYLWVTIGNGMRYGPRYLFSATALAALPTCSSKIQV